MAGNLVLHPAGDPLFGWARNSSTVFQLCQVRLKQFLVLLSPILGTMKNTKDETFRKKSRYFEFCFFYVINYCASFCMEHKSESVFGIINRIWSIYDDRRLPHVEFGLYHQNWAICSTKHTQNVSIWIFPSESIHLGILLTKFKTPDEQSTWVKVWFLLSDNRFSRYFLNWRPMATMLTWIYSYGLRENQACFVMKTNQS